MIKVRGLKKSFGDKEILKGIDLDVETGQTVVIIGPSGSGKSTALRSINRLERPEEGTLTIGEKEYDLANATSKEILEIRKSTVFFRITFTSSE